MTYAPQPIRVFILNFLIDRPLIVNYLDTRPEVLNWFAFTPNAVLVASRSDVTALAGLLRVQFPWLLFLISEVNQLSVQGWINNEVWDFISNPKSSGRWE